MSDLPIDPEAGGLPLPVLVPPGPLTASITKAVEDAVASSVPEGKRGALVTVLGPSGIHVGVTAKLDRAGNWKLSGEAEYAWGGHVSGQAILVGSW
jgi:hypothetical protein